MSNGNFNPFSAADPALGYLYQVRGALLWSLKRLREQQDFLVSIETLDDVTFETTDGHPSDLLQTKHHRNRTATLTDASPDLWKTLRIWFEAQRAGTINDKVNLFLVTTGTAPSDSAASKLLATGRDVGTAIQLLNQVASTSANKTNEAAYKAYLDTGKKERDRLLSKVIVIDAAPTITDMDTDLQQEVYWAVEQQHISAFLDQLEGWWFRKVVIQLNDPGLHHIGGPEIDSQMGDLREQFRRDSLPIHDDLIDFILDEETEKAHADFTFVKQLELVKVGKRRIAISIRDFYRAFEQRSRWVRDHLVVELDLHQYEKRLTEAWEVVFEAMRDELGDSATEDSMEQAARAILSWAEKNVLSIRPNMDEPFISRGSFHMLADDERIGWHPDFESRLASIMGSGAK